MTLAILKQEILEANFLGGTVAPTGSINQGGGITFLDTFSKSGGVGVNPVAGTIEVPDSGAYQLAATVVIDAILSGGGASDTTPTLWARVDDGIGGIVDTRISIVPLVGNGGAISFSFTASFLADLVGSLTTLVSFGISVEAGKNMDTVTIISTSFFMEKIA